MSFNIHTYQLIEIKVESRPRTKFKSIDVNGRLFFYLNSALLLTFPAFHLLYKYTQLTQNQLAYEYINECIFLTLGSLYTHRAI